MFALRSMNPYVMHLPCRVSERFDVNDGVVWNQQQIAHAQKKAAIVTVIGHNATGNIAQWYMLQRAWRGIVIDSECFIPIMMRLTCATKLPASSSPHFTPWVSISSWCTINALKPCRPVRLAFSATGSIFIPLFTLHQTTVSCVLEPHSYVPLSAFRHIHKQQ